jgi:hypothetical protein
MSRHKRKSPCENARLRPRSPVDLGMASSLRLLRTTILRLAASKSLGMSPGDPGRRWTRQDVLSFIDATPRDRRRIGDRTTAATVQLDQNPLRVRAEHDLSSCSLAAHGERSWNHFCFRAQFDWMVRASGQKRWRYRVGAIRSPGIMYR